jgi:two-component system chemotaxis response regulator CheY
MRVLAADDSPTSRLVLARELKRLGHDYVLAADGAQALAALQEAHVDVVISNWLMPGIEGPELCRRLREDDGPYTYFIMLTSLDEPRYVMEGMRAGADDYLVKPFSPNELEARLIGVQRVVALHRRLSAQQAELERLNARLLESSRRDHLTGLLNRRCLDEALDELLARYARYGGSFSVALFDVDRFKHYNDSLGHVAGDEVLRTIADALSAQCREVDRAYRYGGEELLLALPETGLDDAVAAAERIRAHVERLALRHGDGRVTVSAGVATVEPGDQERSDRLLERADRALYEAKRAGRNRVASASRPVAAG